MWIVGIPIICFLLWRVVCRVKDIRELDTRLRKEEAQNAQNPYADMARMYEAQELLDRVKKGGKKK